MARQRRKVENLHDALAAASAAAARARYKLTLYVTGTTPRSQTALVNVRRLCETELHGRYDLEVVDLCKDPALAADEFIIAAPTLVKRQPLPERRFIGDMSQTDRLREGLQLLVPAAST